MKWSNYDLLLGKALKSIIALFNQKVINFNFFHLKSNTTFMNDINAEKVKSFLF